MNPALSIITYFYIIVDVRICKKLHTNPNTLCETITLVCAGCHEDLSEFVSDQTFYVESDKPIMVVQIARSQASRQEVRNGFACLNCCLNWDKKSIVTCHV